MFVKDFMSPEPWTITQERSIKDAKEAMLIHKVRRLPVVSKGTLLGIVTKEDILAASPSVVDFMSAEDMKRSMEGTLVGNIMAGDPYTVDAGDPIENAALIMKEKKIGGLPVLDQGKLAGMITETDIFRAFIQVLGIAEGTDRKYFEFNALPECLEQAATSIEEVGNALASLLIFTRADGKKRMIVRMRIE
ncbi:MAG: CBS domain-containing protein [Planctomycetota bacterium]|jgi:acetoin utilization protein AcuB